MRRVRLVGAALIIAVVCAVATVGAADTDVSRTPDVEAWYQPNPTCPPPIGCLAQVPPLPPTSLYPVGTMHVGFSAGNETARSYLAVRLDDVADKITAATLTVPLSTDPADGDNASATADVQVCLAFGGFKRVEGSFDFPPSVDCLTSAAMSYAGTPAPHLSANLDPLLGALGSATGLALIPDATKAAQSEAWRVVFSAHDRAEGTPPAVLKLTSDDGSDATRPTELDPEPEFVFDDIEPPLGTEFASPVPSNDAVDAGPVATPDDYAPTLVAQRRAYPYKAAWLFPLVLAALFTAILGAMTKDLRT